MNYHQIRAFVNKIKLKNMIKLEDLQCYEDMYYVGDIIDMDGSGWVDEAEAIKILELINQENKSYEHK